jgi:hypothetical protein
MLGNSTYRNRVLVMDKCEFTRTLYFNTIKHSDKFSLATQNSSELEIRQLLSFI